MQTATETAAPAKTRQVHTPKDTVIACEREGVAPCFVRRIGRDGTWTMTWDIQHARLFTRPLAELHAATLTGHGRAAFEAREAAHVQAQAAACAA